eukprot:gene4086-4469_t
MADMKIRRVAIIGSGIGGLAVAACFKAIPSGVEEVVLFDPFDSSSMKESGGAIGLTGGVTILQKIGCGEQLQQVGSKLEQIQYVSTFEDPILQVSLKDAHLWGQPKEEEPCSALGYTIRWSALRKILFDRAFPSDLQPHHRQQEEETKEPVTQSTRFIYRPYHRFLHLEENQTSGKVTLQFGQGVGAEGEFDLVIGADGVQSTVRNFTSHPNETVLTYLPFGKWLPGAYGVFPTGLRVAQCILPLAAPTGGREKINYDEQSTNKLCESFRQHLGDGCNLITLIIGEQDRAYKVLVVIYPQDSNIVTSSQDRRDRWHPRGAEIIPELSKRIQKGGFGRQSTLQYFLQQCSKQDGLVFDLSIRDQLLPLRSWSSESGRIVLVGDSAHTTSPFLGQGANQAIQDAFCLVSMIFKVNNATLSWPDRDSLVNQSLMRDSTSLNLFNSCVVFLKWMLYLTTAPLRPIYSLWMFGLALLSRKNVPNRLQEAVQEYERIRKQHCFVLTLGARLVGYFDVLGGKLGYLLKTLFFAMLQWTGLGKWIFLAPIRPVV